jgi:hypothetical protein
MCAFDFNFLNSYLVPLKQFLYFLVAPTLIFEPFYPRTKRINWGYLVSLAIQTISTTFVVYLVSMFSHFDPLFLFSLRAQRLCHFV